MTTQTTTHLLETLNDQHLLLDATHVQSFQAGILNIPSAALEADVADDFWSGWAARYYRPYNVADGVLTIPIYGSLIDKMGIQVGRWSTGYEYIRRAYQRGIEDPGVRAILLDVDSPGGMASGNFELVDEMRERLGIKPVVGMANGLMLSGGFSIGSVGNPVTVRPSGKIGSVGVITVHMELSQMLQDAGITTTIIRSGQYKAEVNPIEPLTPHAIQTLQRDSNQIYDKFVERVALNRGISEDAVRATEALVYSAEDSLEVDFADSVGDIRTEQARLAGRREGNWMPAPKTEQEIQAEQQQAVADAVKADRKRTADVMASDAYQGREELAHTLLADSDKDAPTIIAQLAAHQVDDSTPANETTVQQQVADAIKADRKRTADVMSSDEYKGREELAAKMLTDTDMSAPAIITMMKAAPKAAADPNGGSDRRNHFAEAMNRQPNPDAGQIDDEGAPRVEENGLTENANHLVRAYKMAGGAGLKQPEENRQRADA